MIDYVVIVIFALLGYLIGSLNAGIIVSKVFYKSDIRNFGSKNAGTTNMLRVFGKKAALFTLLIDLFKGVFACFLAYIIVCVCMGEEHLGVLSVLAAALAAAIGHNWPVYFGFKGGKGVLVSFSVMLFIAPIPALLALAVFILILIPTKYVSLGSILAAFAFPIFEGFIGGWLPETKGFLTASFYVSVIICGMMIIRHIPNIKRLISGTESKISFKK